MDGSSLSTRLIAFGGALALALLIAAVWASGASAATSLGITGVLLLVAVGVLAASRFSSAGRDDSAPQRDRMRNKVP